LSAPSRSGAARVLRRAGANRALALGAALVLAGGSLLACAPSPAAASAIPTTALTVVGGPVAAEGAAVVVTVNAARNLHIEGVAPDTGRVLWSRPYAESAIIPGLAPTLYVLDNVVVDLVPVSTPNGALVDVDGVNATSGATAWRGPQNILVTDAPAPCAQKKFFCVIGYASNVSTAMAVLNPSTGMAVGLLDGPVSALDLDLYQTDAKTPTLQGLSPTATVAWTETVQQLFGAAGYDPVDGWDFLPFGGTEVGTAGATGPDHSDGLDDAKTVGFSLATGVTTWTLPGQFQCGGSLGFLSPAFVCQYTGTLARQHQKSFPLSYQGLGLSLRGFDTGTGAVTWTEPVHDIDTLVNGDAAFSDASHLVVQVAGGKHVLLDATTGKTTALAPHQALWCSTFGLFKVNEDKNLNSAERRAEGSRYSPCTAAGHPTDTLPPSSPSTIGVTVDGVFLWPSPHGLSRRVVGSAEGSA
jgi:hypothetical protein